MESNNYKKHEKEVIDKIVKTLVEEKGYPRNCILIEERIKFGNNLIIPDIIITSKNGKKFIGLIEVKLRISEAIKLQAMAQIISYNNSLKNPLPSYLIIPNKENFNAFYYTEKREWISIDFNDFPTYEYLEKLDLRKTALEELEKQESEKKYNKTKKYWSTIGLGIGIAGIVTSLLVGVLSDQLDFSKKYEEQKLVTIMKQNLLLEEQIHINQLRQDSLMNFIENLLIVYDSVTIETKTKMELIKMSDNLNFQIAKKQDQIDSLNFKLNNLNTYLEYNLEKAFTPKLLDSKFEKIESKLEYEVKLIGKDLESLEKSYRTLITLLITVFAAIIVNFIPNIKNNK